MDPREGKVLIIMFTDIVGFSGIMNQDQNLGFQILELNRKIHRTTVESFGGTLVKELGDGFLITFESNSLAIRCAIEIQRKIYESGKYKLRISIHLGEVSVEHNDVIGDGVNLASKIEEVTPSEAIYISDSVYENVHNRSEFKFIEVGKINLRGIGSQTTLYGVETDFLPTPTSTEFERLKRVVYGSGRRQIGWVVATISLIVAAIIYFGFLKSMDPASPIDPSLAVIPFENISSDSSVGYFCIGVTEDILYELSKVEGLKIVDRYNLRNYENLNKTSQELADELGVANLLYGTIRKSRDRVRVSARLVKIPENEQLWAAQYDEALDDIFNIQSFIASEIANAMQKEMVDRNDAKPNQLGISSYEAYDFYLKANEYYHRYTLEDNLSAMELYREAIDLEPGFTLAKAGLGNAFGQMAARSNFPEVFLDSTFYYGTEVIVEAPEISQGYQTVALYYSLNGDYRRAIEEYKKAIDIDNNVYAVINLSRLYYQSGNFKEAMNVLSSGSSNNYLNHEMWYNYASIYFRMSDPDKAEFYLDKALTINPNHVPSLLLQWMMALMKGDQQRAFQTADRIGLIGGDNIDLVLNTIMNEVLAAEHDWEESALAIKEVFNGSEIDYIELPYVYNLTAFVYWKGGYQPLARELLNFKVDSNLKQMEKGDLSYDLPYEISQAYSISVQYREAEEWLDKAIDAGWSETSYLKFDPIMSDFRGRPQSLELLQTAQSKLDSINRLFQEK